MPRQLISQQILDILHTHHFLTAPQLVATLHEQGKNVNKTTVYRALEKLKDSDQICQHNLQNDELVYELRADHHDHLICTHCQRIQKVDCQLEIPTEIAGYQISHHHLSVYGLCPACQQTHET